MAPGGALAGLAEGTVAAGLGRLSDDELAGMLGAERRLEARHAAIGLAAVAELDRRRSAGHPDSSREGEHVSEELAAALVLTGRSADCLLGLARGLARLPGVLAALLARSSLTGGMRGLSCGPNGGPSIVVTRAAGR